MKRLLRSGGVVAGVLVALVVAFVVGMMTGAGGVVADGAPVSSGAPSATHTPISLPTPSPAPVALFVGDSYTVGQDATPARRWSTVVSHRMGWTELNVAIGGTGFVSRFPNRARLSYPEQIAAVRNPEQVDVVVIAGGQNDFNDVREDPQQVFEAVSSTYSAAVRRFPDAQIVAVGPSTQRQVGLEVRAIDSAVRAAAEKYDATYVSLLDPNVIRKKFVSQDGVHVTNQGHRAIANRVLAQIS